MDFLQMMQLESHGPDTWIGAGPRYPWGGLYGGQIVAQGLRAAAHSVDPKFAVHSLHAYFVRRGDHEAPVRYEIDRVRDGRTFMTRNVTARQSTGAILNMIVSFQLPEDEPATQTVPAPTVPPADELKNVSWSPLFERRTPKYKHPAPAGAARYAWARIVGELPSDPLLHACALAYISDDLPTEAAVSRHPDHVRDATTQFWNASLDHAIWFHDAMKADAYHLYEFDCHALRGGRALSTGNVFSADGRHVATINQEVLLRRQRA